MNNSLKKFAMITLWVLLLIVYGCGSSLTPESVAEKINNNEELTKQDYDIMMDYIVDNINSIIDDIKNDDRISAVNTLYDMDQENLIPLFEQQIPGFSDAVITSVFLGGKADIDRTPYYPKGVKIEGAEDVIKDINFSDQPTHLSLACTVNGKDYFITPDEWTKMNETQRSAVMKRGISIVKDGEAFVITDLNIGSINNIETNLTRSQRAHLPSRKQAQCIVNDLENFQNNSNIFGLAGLKGIYFTRDEVKGSDPSAHYIFSSSGKISTMQSVMNNEANVSTIKSLYETEPEGFSLEKLNNENAPISIEIRLSGNTYFIPLADYWKIPETVRVEIWGIRINKDGIDLVIDVLKPEKGSDLYSSNVALEKYYDNLPTPNEAKVIKNNIEEIDAALASVAGYPLGGGTTRSYFMRKKAEPKQETGRYSYSYGGSDDIVFLENDGMIDFVELEENPYNQAHIRKMWRPDGTIPHDDIEIADNALNNDSLISRPDSINF